MTAAATRSPSATRTSGIARHRNFPRPTSVETLRHEIDRVFENFGASSSRHPFDSPSFEPELLAPRTLLPNSFPAVDIVERRKSYRITAELPGLDGTDIEVELSNGILTISGEKSNEKETREKERYLSERRFGYFVRSFHLPDGVNTDDVEARFAKGVLTIKLLKTKTKTKPRHETTITVKAA